MNNLLMLEPGAFALLEAAEFSAAALPGAQYRGGQMTVENGIASIDISGAMVYDKSLLGAFLATVFGATLTPELQASLRAAADDPKVQGVVLRVNSPGGMVAGIEETARLVHDLAQKKPVVALAESLSASAAYWPTSAATKAIALGKTVAIGSVGVLATVDVSSDSKKLTFVSSQSPKKRMDPSTEEGKAALQSHIDGIAQVFIDSVASYRGKTSAQVQSDFGQGGLLLAEAAKAAGMIDQVGTESEAITTLRSLMTHKTISGANQTAPSATAEPPQGDHMEQQQVDKAAIQAEAAQAERTRIAAILALEEAKGREAVAQRLAMTPGMTAESAKDILAATPKANPLATAMATVPNPAVKPGEEAAAGNQAEIDAEVSRILALSGDLPKENK